MILISGTAIPMAEGFFGLLGKPFNLEKLAQVVIAALDTEGPRVLNKRRRRNLTGCSAAFNVATAMSSSQKIQSERVRGRRWGGADAPGSSMVPGTVGRRSAERKLLNRTRYGVPGAFNGRTCASSSSGQARFRQEHVYTSLQCAVRGCSSRRRVGAMPSSFGMERSMTMMSGRK